MKPRRTFHDPVPNPGFGTLTTHYAEEPGAPHTPASPPIYQTSTFLYPDAATWARRRTPDCPQHEYTRVSNPTIEILEGKLARLEKGAWAQCFGSGMGAISSSINALIHQGAHVVSVAHVYGPARTYLSHVERFGVSTTYVPGARTADFLAALRPETRLLYLESPTSGWFECPDVRALAAAARERGVFTLIDNSWASPYFCNPLELGVDLVIHSATKYLNGHSDVVAGVVIGRDETLQHKLLTEAEFGGATLDPFAAWLMLRGLRTLGLRMQYHHATGLEVARWLEEQPGVERVLHPGLPSHPEHEICRAQCRGFGSLFSLFLKDASLPRTQRLLDSLRLFRIGVSWGGHESLVVAGAHGRDSANEARCLVRLYCGLEDAADLIGDLRQALTS